MSKVLISILIAGLLPSNAPADVRVTATSAVRDPSPQASTGLRTPDHLADLPEFDRLRIDGFNAVYNIDYKTARERFLQMTRLAPEHPAGYVYLANNLWLETLYQTHRLTTSVYTGGSF